MKSIKVSELIAALEKTKAKWGDLPVVMSSDPEGNSWGSIRAEDSFGSEHGLITLWPCEQYGDFEDVDGYVPGEDDED